MAQVRRWWWVGLVVAHLTRFLLAEGAPTAQDVINHASQGKDSFLNILSEVQNNLPTPNEPQLLYDYIGLLDELKKIGQSYGYKLPIDSPLAVTALALTRNAVTVIRIGSDPWDFVKLYFRWSDDVTRATAAQQQIEYTAPLQAKADLLFWHGRLAGSIDYLKELHAQPYVGDALAEVDASVLNKLLMVPEGLTPDEMDKVLAVTKTASAIQYAFDYLEQEGVAATDGARALQIFNWTLTLANNLKAMGSAAPFSLKTYPTRLMTQCLSKCMVMGVAPSSSVVPNIMANLMTSQYAEVGATFSELFRERAIPANVLDFLYVLGEELWKAQKKQGFQPPTRDYKRFLQRVALLDLQKTENYEGGYDLAIAGERARLTLSPTGNGGLVAGLRIYREGYNSGDGVDFSFFHFLYNFETKEFEMHRFETYPDQTFPSSQRNWEMRFHFLERADGKELEIVGTYDNGLGIKNFSGVRTSRFPDLGALQSNDAHPPEAARSLAGPWTGSVGNLSAMLTLSQENDRLSGILIYEKRIAEIPFPTGIVNYSTGIITLTSGEMDKNQKYVQIRGRFSSDFRSFNGYYVIGGQGAPLSVSLTKR